MKIKLGGSVSMDLDKLIESRLLVQANSGGGKSWAIRRIVEQSFGKKQIIILDPEGEFGNLRSEFDFVYAGKGGDAPVESRSAALLAHRLLELKASTIVDLYELVPQERKHFVRLFCDAMVNAPKDLWHDVIIIIDEAHVFAPEKGESEAMGAVIDLATRGRKRGYCVVLATQRLPKLNKDAAAECNNKLIGRASQDIDRKRAAEELGFSSKEDVLSLRDLEPGEFYAFGPAISREVIKVTIGDVTVKPAKRGVSKSAIAAPSATVKKILGKLSDLPQEAKKQAETVAELKKENAELKRKGAAAPVTKEIQQKWYDMGVAAAEHSLRKEINRVGREGAEQYNNVLKTLKQIAKIIMPYVDGGAAVFNGKEVPLPTVLQMPVQKAVPLHTPTRRAPAPASDGPLSGPEQRILDAIALSESIGITEPEQTAVAFLAGYTYGGGGFNNPRGALKTKGLVEYRGSRIALTEEGRALSNTPDAPLTNQTMRDTVMSILPGPEQKLLGPLMDAYPEAMSNAELAAASGYTEGSGGFNNPKGRLRSLGLIDYPSSGYARAKDLLFPNSL